MICTVKPRIFTKVECAVLCAVGWGYNVKSLPSFAITIVSNCFQAPRFAFENFDFPIVGSKIKVVVESSVTYQNLSVEKCKTN